MVKSLELVPRYEGPSSWWEHVPVAHAIVEYTKPEIIVELGSHYGVSLFSFCEAAEKYSPMTFIYGIDTWEGDAHAGYYKDEVYQLVDGYRKDFHSQRLTLIRSLFDDAVHHFSDSSIDILHIDGLHTYDSVSHDLKTWLPKLKDGGTILFHDCSVKKDDFGVWKLWEEVKASQEFKCLEFKNGYGLGVASKVKEVPVWHGELEDRREELKCKGVLLEKINNLKEEIKRDNIIKRTNAKHIENLEEIVEAQRKELDTAKNREKRRYSLGELIKRITASWRRL